MMKPQHLDVQLRRQLDDQLYDQLYRQLDAQLRDRLYDQLDVQLNNLHDANVALKNKLYGRIYSQLRYEVVDSNLICHHGGYVEFLLDCQLDIETAR